MAEVETIDVRTTRREELIDITSLVRAAVRKAGAQGGLVCVYCPHTTAAVTLQENSDPTVKSDLLRHLARVVPQDHGFEHAEDNQDAHIKSSLVGASVTLIIDQGKPLLGSWQAIYFCEFDGPRQRKVLVRVVAG
jgi:secondary thiamine-phosphate synthase enzyme